MWSDLDVYETATFQNQRRSGWQYDAAGNVTNDGTSLLTYDAAGRNVMFRDGTGEVTQQHDGDGQVVRRDPKLKEPLFYLRSSVLGGQVMVEINGMGASAIWSIPRGVKIHTHVYNGALRVATHMLGELNEKEFAVPNRANHEE